MNNVNIYKYFIKSEKWHESACFRQPFGVFMFLRYNTNKTSDNTF